MPLFVFDFFDKSGIIRRDFEAVMDSYFICSESDNSTIISGNPILRRLKEEKAHKIMGGLYHEVQIRMTYNSNHIEGSCLSQEQTRYIFETKTIDTGNKAIPTDDIIETINHFRAIDYCIDVAEETLSETIIKKIHYILKTGTGVEDIAWFKIGDYKLKPNMVGGIKTTEPNEVSTAIQALLSDYLKKQNISFEDIIDFHYNFELIHPFQDGNGRVGRLIAFKECLKHNIVPFIIEDDKKYFYYRGLREYTKASGYLIDTCYDGQDVFNDLVKVFEV